MHFRSCGSEKAGMRGYELNTTSIRHILRYDNFLMERAAASHKPSEWEAPVRGGFKGLDINVTAISFWDS